MANTQTCGCRSEGRTIYACHGHNIVAALFAYFHGPEDYHLDCCDVPMAQRELKHFDGAAMWDAVALLPREADRAYARRVLTAADKT